MAGYRAVACAVIERAVTDALSRYCSTQQSAVARAWLRHSEDLAFWCAIAGLDVERVRRVALNGLPPSRRRPERWRRVRQGRAAAVRACNTHVQKVTAMKDLLPHTALSFIDDKEVRNE